MSSDRKHRPIKRKKASTGEINKRNKFNESIELAIKTYIYNRAINFRSIFRCNNHFSDYEIYRENETRERKARKDREGEGTSTRKEILCRLYPFIIL